MNEEVDHIKNISKFTNIQNDPTVYSNPIDNVIITAILPAHNESKGIGASIDSIRPYVDHIIVACDNCSDDTANIAKAHGADDVFNTVNNHYRKAGGLNQALEHHVNWHLNCQYLLIMDADTIIANPKAWFRKATSLIFPNRPVLSQRAYRLLYHPINRISFRFKHPKQYHKLFDNKAFDCVGSIFQAPDKLKHDTNLEEGQRLEWEAYQSKIERSRKVFVLTGTCSLISSKVMWAVYKLHHYKYFYDIHSITEDFAMTISVKEVNARLISPTDCLVKTATKSSIKGLLSQRRRWYLGALDLVNKHKINNVLLPYLGQQAMLFISVFAYLLFLAVAIYLYLKGEVELTLFWTIVFIGYDWCETARVWKYGNAFDKLYSASIIGCLYYALILQLAYLWALETFIDNKKVYWNSKEKAKVKKTKK